jgi:hypothetical protein
VNFEKLILTVLNKFKISIRYTEIESIIKKKTAVVIPNAIQVNPFTGPKHFFHGFMSPRDQIYNLLVQQWMQIAPKNASMMYSMMMVKRRSMPESGSGGDLCGVGLGAGYENGGVEGVEGASIIPRPQSTPPDAMGGGGIGTGSSTNPSNPSKDYSGPVKVVESGGLDCPCKDQHDAWTSLVDMTVEVPMETVWNVLFSDESNFRKVFLETDRKCTNVIVDRWNPSASAQEGMFTLPPVNAIRNLEYVIPLGVVSPKTKVQENITASNPSYICVLSHSATPDVFMGDHFRTTLRLCVSQILKKTFPATSHPQEQPLSVSYITRLRISYDVEFLKPTRWFTKTSVTSMMKPKVVEYHDALRVSLEKELETQTGGSGVDVDGSEQRLGVETGGGGGGGAKSNVGELHAAGNGGDEKDIGGIRRRVTSSRRDGGTKTLSSGAVGSSGYHHTSANGNNGSAVRFGDGSNAVKSFLDSLRHITGIHIILSLIALLLFALVVAVIIMAQEMREFRLVYLKASATSASGIKGAASAIMPKGSYGLDLLSGEQTNGICRL